MKKVSIIIIIIYLFNIELFYSICHFLNLHNGHKLLLIDNEESLKRENITLEHYTKKINEIIQKGINLKDKVNKEIIKAYKNKYKILIEEEKNLKDNLLNEVTKIKEKLEYFLSNWVKKITKMKI